MMASADLIKKLFKSYKQRDDEKFYATALEVIAEEKRKNHKILARDLRFILDNGNNNGLHDSNIMNFQKLPRDKERGTILAEIRNPNRYLTDIILHDNLTQQMLSIFSEYRAKSILKTHGLTPKLKMLFAGPPGCGKTLCAEVIAHELGLPLLYIRFDSVISSYLGETAANLRKVFDYAEQGSWVVFFDEFDAIGKSRNNLDEHGELKRVVNTYLQLVDNFQSDSLIIAATNHELLLDKALWRRFDDILYFDVPDNVQITDLIKLKLKSIHHKKLNYEDFIEHMVGWSHADIERVCLDAIKISILGNDDEVTNHHFKKAFEQQTERFNIIQKSNK